MVWAGPVVALTNEHAGSDGDTVHIRVIDTGPGIPTEMLGRVADRGVQVHGGAGYINEYPVERFYRDARLLRLYEGTTQVQQLIIGRELLRQD